VKFTLELTVEASKCGWCVGRSGSPPLSGGWQVVFLLPALRGPHQRSKRVVPRSAGDCNFVPWLQSLFY